MQNNIALHYKLAETLNINGRKHPLIAYDTETLLLIFRQKAVISNSITREGRKHITIVTMHFRGYVKTYKWHGFGKLIYNCQCHNLHTLKKLKSARYHSLCLKALY